MPGPIDPAICSIDLLVKRVVRVGIRDSDSTQRTAHALLGLDSAVTSPWPSQAEVAEASKVTRGRIGQIVAKLSTRWSKDPAIGLLRTNVVELLKASGGIQRLRSSRRRSCRAGDRARMNRCGRGGPGGGAGGGRG